MAYLTNDSVVPRVYANFRGVDFRGDEVNLVRSPDSLNVWKDYRKTESIRTRPGMRLKEGFTQPVYGIFFYKDFMIVHSGADLYTVTAEGVRTRIYSGLNTAASNSFVYEDALYLMDGKGYFQYNWDDENKKGTFQPVQGYVPTTSISRSAMSGGSTKQDANMLTGLRINTFLADGKNKVFYLDAKEIDDDYLPRVTFTDQNAIDFTVDYDEGTITFASVPSAPLTDGRDNISVQFRKTIDGYRDSILKCTLLQVFDNRVFFSGNPEYPNVVWHCSLNDPSYVSDLDYYREGMDTAQIKGLVAGNNALWVFREPSDANTNVFYHTPTIDDEYGKIYPSTHSSVTTGCVGKAINFNDDIVFFSDRGMEGISGDVTTEQVVAHRSSLVDSKMISEKDYKNMVLEEWEGYLLVIIGDKVYLADSRTAFTNEDHIEYDWFYWKLEKKVICTRVHDGVLHLGTEDGIYTLDDNSCAVESWWTTPKDKFKHPHKLKTTNKRGCVAEAEGDIAVYAKVEDTEYELIGEYKDVKDYFVSRIKRKKFKDIQLKFYSSTRFSLETVTLECFIGGYIKR